MLTCEHIPVPLCVDVVTCSGLHDMCTMSHWPEDAATAPHPAPSPCLFTEPTALPMVESVARLGIKVPPFRLDYALGNNKAVELGIHCAVMQTEVTQTLSDHFPIACRYPRTAQEDANGYDWRR